MHKLHKQTTLTVATGISLGSAIISGGLTLAALTPTPTWTPKMSNSPTLLGQRAHRLNKDEIFAAHNQYRKQVGVPPLKWSDSVAGKAQQWADEPPLHCPPYMNKACP